MSEPLTHRIDRDLVQDLEQRCDHGRAQLMTLALRAADPDNRQRLQDKALAVEDVRKDVTGILRQHPASVPAATLDGLYDRVALRAVTEGSGGRAEGLRLALDYVRGTPGLYERRSA